MSSSNGKGKGKEPAKWSSGPPADKAGGRNQSSNAEPDASMEELSDFDELEVGTGPTGGRGGRTGRDSNTADWGSSVATSWAWTDQRVGSVLDKRPASPVGDAMAEGAKKRNVSFVMTSTDQISRETDMFGRVTRFELKDGSKRGEPIVTPNPVRVDATDVSFNLEDPRGWAILKQAADSLGKMNVTQVVFTIQGVHRPVNDEGEANAQPPVTGGTGGSTGGNAARDSIARLAAELERLRAINPGSEGGENAAANAGTVQASAEKLPSVSRKKGRRLADCPPSEDYGENTRMGGLPEE